MTDMKMEYAIKRLQADQPIDRSTAMTLLERIAGDMVEQHAASDSVGMHMSEAAFGLFNITDMWYALMIACNNALVVSKLVDEAINNRKDRA